MKIYFSAALFVVLVIIPNAYPQTILIDDSLTIKKIGLMTQYFEDSGKAMSLADVKRPENESNWKSFEKESQGFGYTQSAYWVRFTVQNSSGQSRTIYLQEDYPLIDSLILYIPDKTHGYVSMETGDRKPFFERPFKHRTFVFPLILDANETQTYYLR